MKLGYEFPLCPCPWCRKTPHLELPIMEDTWVWDIRCDNYECPIKPRSPHVSIRKTGKGDPKKIREKLDTLVKRWNECNPIRAYEKKVVDLGKLFSLVKC